MSTKYLIFTSKIYNYLLTFIQVYSSHLLLDFCKCEEINYVVQLNARKVVVHFYIHHPVNQPHSVFVNDRTCWQWSMKSYFHVSWDTGANTDEDKWRQSRWIILESWEFSLGVTNPWRILFVWSRVSTVCKLVCEVTTALVKMYQGFISMPTGQRWLPSMCWCHKCDTCPNDNS